MSLFAPDLRAAVEAYGGVFPPEFKKTTLADADPAITPRGFRPVGTIHQYIDEFVDDIDAFKPGGTIRILTGEADPRIYNNPLVIESLSRAGDPYQSMFEHYNRSVRMGQEDRYEDALYDLDYTIMLMLDKLDLTPEFVKGMESPQAKRFFQNFGASVFSNTADALIHLNKPKETLRIVLPQARKFHPKQPYLNANYARAYLALNNPSKAIRAMQRELAINPSYPGMAEDWLSTPASKDSSG